MADRRLQRHFSPLRYPGGKGRLSGFVQQLFKQNHLMDGCYVEPYAGGAGVALSLLFMEYASTIYINDISEPVYCFWKSVLKETDALCKLVRDRPVSAAEWKRQKAVLRDPRNHSALDLAFSLFFLNRTNRSGIIHTGGMIGGNSQSGTWKLDARYNKADLIARIESIALYSNRITVSKADAEKFLADVAPQLPKKNLIYLDPPYFTQGQSLYENHYQPDDHRRLSKYVRTELQPNWMISYDNHPEIRKAYRGCRKLIYSLSYSAADRYEGSEVMFFSRNLTLPRATSPADH